VCAAGTALGCDDGNPCTAESCDANGCQHTVLADGTSCSDGNACNGFEACRAGTCTASVGEGSHCGAEEFNGSALGSQWNDHAVGAAPTYTVLGSQLTITDASLAYTASSGNESWIYDLDLDRGNQMAWSWPIGTGDFDVTFDFGWTSSDGELTLGAVGVADANGMMDVMAGYMDGGAPGLGNPFARVRQPGPDLRWDGAASGAGSGKMRITRKGGTVSVYYNDVLVLSGASAGDLRQVVVVAVPYRYGAAAYPFGTFTLQRLSVCGGPYVEANLSCDDANACTTDSCDATFGCQNAPQPPSTSCSDGNACNGFEACRAGTCTSRVGEGSNCGVDELNGNALGSQWNDHAVGAAPTYTVLASQMTVTDASPAYTPSSGNESWIYDLDLDRGNQMAWSWPIGTGDFDVTFDFGWTSSDGELTLGAVGVADANGMMDVMAGYMDGWAPGTGNPFARVRQPGADLQWDGATSGAGSGKMRITRKGGTVSVYYNDALVLAGASAGDLRRVVVVTVPYRYGATTYPFGTFTLQRLSVCGGPYVEPNLSCDDANACTTDSCDTTLGCQNVPVAAGTSCSDGMSCNGVESCQAGMCTARIADGSTCSAEEFDGSTLGGQWNDHAAGSAPTYSVLASQLAITNASLASTPSSPNESWIYDLDVDKGNQMAWSWPIGVGDFDVTFDFGWTSSDAELTLGAVGVASSSGIMDVMAGYMDGWAPGTGNPFARVRQAGTDLHWDGTSSGAGSGKMRLTRQSGTVKVYYNDALVLSGTSTGDLQRVVVVAVPYRYSTTNYPFGTFFLQRLSVCAPYVESAASMCGP
jgi:hypothetical protein